jgi:hypothetical protein
MCGTPNASRDTVARMEIGAAISPEACGRGRQAIQYAPTASPTSKTAMLRLIARNRGVLNNKLRL